MSEVSEVGVEVSETSVVPSTVLQVFKVSIVDSIELEVSELVEVVCTVTHESLESGELSAVEELDVPTVLEVSELSVASVEVQVSNVAVGVNCDVVGKSVVEGESAVLQIDVSVLVSKLDLDSALDSAVTSGGDELVSTPEVLEVNSVLASDVVALVVAMLSVLSSVVVLAAIVDVPVSAPSVPLLVWVADVPSLSVLDTLVVSVPELLASVANVVPASLLV